MKKFYAYFISVFEPNFQAKFLTKILKKKNSFFQKRYSNKHFPNIFRMCSIDSEWYQSDILDLHIDFRYFSKKCQNRFLKRICLLAEKIPLFLLRSSDIVKPLLELCRVDPGDAFTYLSWSHIMSRSNFRIRENFFSNFTFYAYFYKGNFKAPVEKLFSAHLTNSFIEF